MVFELYDFEYHSLGSSSIPSNNNIWVSQRGIFLVPMSTEAKSVVTERVLFDERRGLYRLAIIT